MTNTTHFAKCIPPRLLRLWRPGICVLFLSLFFSNVQATTFYKSTTSGGDWNTTSTWLSSTSVGGPYNTTAVLPTTANPVEIVSGATVTISATTSIAQVTIDNGGVLTINGSTAVTLSKVSAPDLVN